MSEIVNVSTANDAVIAIVDNAPCNDADVVITIIDDAPILPTEASVIPGRKRRRIAKSNDEILTQRFSSALARFVFFFFF
jgi:hypothetical protein